MAQNPYVNKVVFGAVSIIDISDTTATASDVAQGKYFYAASGEKIEGTAIGGGGAAITVTDTTDTHGGIIREITGVDISEDTVTAAHLESGYTAHDAEGNAITGTLTPGITPTGTINITTNGTHDVTNYASASVNVPSSVPNIQALSVTQNGTYTASGGVDGYSPVTVNVSGGGGLEYETGTFTPASLTGEYQITFANTHTTAPFFYMILDTTGTYLSESNRNHSLVYANFGQFFGEAIDVNNTGTFNYGNQISRYRATNATSMTGSSGTISTPYTDSTNTGTANSRYWATETGIKAYTGSTSRYWSPNRTYSWVAVWTPTT